MVGKLEWIDAGLSALVDGGPEAVRVEPVAKALKVTKGSFYWHFADRPAWLAAIRARWEQIATQAVIDRVERAGPDPQGRLETLFTFTTRHHPGHVLEAAIRAWSLTDPKTRAVTRRIDKKRLGYVKDLLVGLGHSSAQAQLRAQILYLALLGEMSLVAHGGRASPPPVFQTLLALATRRS